ncbi:MAG: LysM peptidoglycan-binding domain-containing protein [Actinomycetaceae bacterium]
MPVAIRAHRRGARRRPLALATIATTAIGAPTLLAVPALAADAPVQTAPQPVAAARGALPQATTTTAARAGLLDATRATPVRQSPEETAYTVRRGDTLYGIAAGHATTVTALQQANSLSGSLILPGQRLTLPGGAVTAPSPASGDTTGGSYQVAAGDTLIGIARAHGTTVRELQQANGLTGTIIRSGQTLTIPGAGSSSTAGSEAPAPSGGSYTVRAGDTLTGIAASQGTSVDALASANSLTSAHRIYVGQRLTLPGSSGAASSGPVTSDPGNTSGGVGSTFAGRTYPEAVVGAANANRTQLVEAGVPSRAEMQELVRSTAVSMGVDPRLALAHAFVESGFNHASVSPANAIGTMQVIPSSGEWASQLVGRTLNIMNPQDNVVAGVAIIRALQGSADDSDQGIGAYYQGLGGVRANGMYADTEQYVATVRAAMNRF